MGLFGNNISSFGSHGFPYTTGGNVKKADRSKYCPECNIVVADGDEQKIVTGDKTFHLAHFLNGSKAKVSKESLSCLREHYAQLKQKKTISSEEEKTLGFLKLIFNPK